MVPGGAVRTSAPGLRLAGTTAAAQRTLSLDLAVDPQAAGLARDAMGRFGGLAPDSLHDLKIVASELVSNVVVHSGLRAPQTLRLMAHNYDTSVRITVRDEGRGFDYGHVLRPERLLVIGGLGLFVVDRISLDWGISSVDGAVVWADVPVHRLGTAQSGRLEPSCP
jgi:anti-sigma regulatory factor (Ser/Thr protein kinase)